MKTVQLNSWAMTENDHRKGEDMQYDQNRINGYKKRLMWDSKRSQVTKKETEREEMEALDIEWAQDIILTNTNIRMQREQSVTSDEYGII